MDPVIGVRFRDHLRAASKTVSKGVCSGRARASIGMWDQWLTFCAELGIDPFLQASVLHVSEAWAREREGGVGGRRREGTWRRATDWFFALIYLVARPLRGPR